MNNNNILVIGNGFDLACKYDTRYIDFINFIKLINNDKNGINNINEKRIRSFIERFDNNKTIIEKSNRYNEFVKIIENNCFVKYFLEINYDINIWSDVEEEMHRIIEAINSIFNDDNLNNISIKQAHSNRELCVRFNDEFIKKVMLEFNLVEKRFVNFSNESLHPLNVNYYDYIYKIKWKNLIDYLNKELESFKKALIIYLKDYVPIIKGMYFDEKIDKQLREEIKPNQIITFNYTDYYKQYYNCESIHIHGRLEDEKIVLGFGEDDNISLKYCRFNKYFQRIQNKLQIIRKSDKIFNVKEEDNVLDRVIIPGMVKKNVVHFFGLSFDISDEDYIKELYECDNNIKNIVYYYDNNDYDTKIINLIKIFDKTKITNDIHNGKLVLQQIGK